MGQHIYNLKQMLGISRVILQEFASIMNKHIYPYRISHRVKYLFIHTGISKASFKFQYKTDQTFYKGRELESHGEMLGIIFSLLAENICVSYLGSNKVKRKNIIEAIKMLKPYHFSLLLNDYVKENPNCEFIVKLIYELVDELPELQKLKQDYPELFEAA